jgi:dCMP deaminase
MTISPNDHRNIALLGQVLRQSHDPHRPVAAIIADASGRPVADGANTPPAAFHYSPADTRAAIAADPTWKYFMMEHAERNAILHATASHIPLIGATMYGSLFPCADCARAIAASGIKRLVVPAPGLHPARDEKWMDHYRYAQQILQLSGVTVDFFAPEEAGPIANATASQDEPG